jgi:hypothetical protein
MCETKPICKLDYYSQFPLEPLNPFFFGKCSPFPFIVRQPCVKNTQTQSLSNSIETYLSGRKALSRNKTHPQRTKNEDEANLPGLKRSQRKIKAMLKQREAQKIAGERKNNVRLGCLTPLF